MSAPTPSPSPRWSRTSDENAQALAKAKVATPKANAPAKLEKTVTLLVTKFSEVIVNGKSGDLSALHKGMKVDVTKGTTETEAAPHRGNAIGRRGKGALHDAGEITLMG